jgi:hypothetical protein
MKPVAAEAAVSKHLQHQSFMCIHQKETRCLYQVLCQEAVEAKTEAKIER